MTDAAAPAATAPRWQALAVLLFGACVIGFAPILVRLTDAGPAAAAFWRLTFALPLLAILSVRTAGAIGRAPPLALLAGVFFFLDLVSWHYGIHYTSVANATVLSNLTPVVVTIFAWVFLKQRPAMLFLVAVALAVGGAWLMAVEHTGGGLRNQPLGDALSVLTALWYSLYFLAIGEARKRDGAYRLMFWISLTGAPLCLLAAIPMGEQILPQTVMGWGAVIGLGVMHVAGQGSIAWAMGRLPASTTSVVVLIQPVVAAWLGWMLFAEPIGPLQAAGAAVTLGGVVLAQWASRRT